MRKTLLLTAILAFVSTAALAGTSSSLQKTQFSFENATNHAITVEVFDFVGTWGNPIQQHFKVTLAPHDIKSASFYENILLTKGNGFVGIQASSAKAKNDSVTINASHVGASVVTSSGTLVEQTSVINSKEESGVEHIDIGFLK